MENYNQFAVEVLWILQSVYETGFQLLFCHLIRRNL